ncbi:YhjD/YihY/BrkB family envelope integrity protein [Gordonia sp. (in: high G+C Gram-positive bacteria)]|uniref:YhjD/YihY/BrkB family envelope integrity protein n=1 Tax=Gordonia sp. (in: high G+C Gram-positive bacteria) TaxID=84139 RepID=UPI00262C34D1|nr:YhjD/YihY/BrkB family envelope integrity protein [Gordonia sp. (in: high G+C Gram-positive bacteria)]
MGAIVGKIKALVAWATALFNDLKVRWPWLTHILNMLARYTDRRGNVYAAAITFSGILSLVPILMVTFAIAGFVLASQPQLVDRMVDAVVDAAPGQMGETLSGVIQSAIDSRAAVGVIGLLSAAFTGIGWMSLVRTALSEMWGGRVKRNAVKSYVSDLATFFFLGLMFVLTFALTALAVGPVTHALLDWLDLAWLTRQVTLLRWGSTLIATLGTWWLFSIVLARLPLHPVPMRAVRWPALTTAIIFTVLKELGGLYLQSVLTSPAGVAFGPLLGVMVFTYLASRIVLYAAAWSAASEDNAQYRIVDEFDVPPPEQPAPVVLAPVYEEPVAPKTRALLTAAGLGAAAAGVYGWLRRR